MVQAFTTAAVINNSVWPRPEAVSWLRYAPNHPEFEGEDQAGTGDLTPEQEEASSECQAKIMQLAAEMKAGGGVLLQRVIRGEEIR